MSSLQIPYFFIFLYNDHGVDMVKNVKLHTFLVNTIWWVVGTLKKRRREYF